MSGTAHSEPGPSNSLRCRLALPRGYRHRDLLNFHARDHQALAEQVERQSLRKAMRWQGLAIELTLRFGRSSAQAVVSGPVTDADRPALRNMVKRMLGLDQDIEAFEAKHAAHPELGPVIRHNTGLRIPQTPTAFEALSWAIIGQQISLSAAVSIRRRLIAHCALLHPCGLHCFPDAGNLAGLSPQTLAQLGFSQAKAHTLLNLSRDIDNNVLGLEPDGHFDPERLTTQLLAYKGIGPWTVNYTLLRGFGHLDGSLHGDVAVRRQLQRLRGSATPPRSSALADWLDHFRPWRALAAAHLWAARIPPTDTPSIPDPKAAGSADAG